VKETRSREPTGETLSKILEKGPLWIKKKNRRPKIAQERGRSASFRNGRKRRTFSFREGGRTTKKIKKGAWQRTLIISGRAFPENLTKEKNPQKRSF